MIHVHVEAEKNTNSAADANERSVVKYMVITGFHSIEEKLRAAGKAEKSKGSAKATDTAAAGLKIFYSKPGPRIKKILAAAKEAGIPAEQTEDSRLNEMVSGLDEKLRDHRGIVMEIKVGAARGTITFQR